MGMEDVRATRSVLFSQGIDKLARRGRVLEHMVAAGALATPARAGLLTGSYPVRLGMASSADTFRTFYSPGQVGGLPHGTVTLADELLALGYATAAVGTWHLGMSDASAWSPNGAHLPLAHGFESYYGMPVSHALTCAGDGLGRDAPRDAVYILFLTYHVWISLVCLLGAAYTLGAIGSVGFKFGLMYVAAAMGGVYLYAVSFSVLNPAACVLFRDNELVEQPVVLANLTSRLVQEATQFIGGAAASPQPFFLYFALPEADLASVDGAVAAVVDALDAAGVFDNTLVIFTSDNGPHLERATAHGRAQDGRQLRGGKGQVWDGGFRVPGIISWPHHIEGGTVSTHPASHLDIVPTVLDAVHGVGRGLAARIGRSQLDGVSLVDAATTSPDRPLFHYCGDQLAAVRLGRRHKVVYESPVPDAGTQACASTFVCGCHGTVHDPPLVFDLAADPSESAPLAPSDVAVAAVLASAADAVHTHQATVSNVPNQLETIARPWLFPCCDWPKCHCLEARTAT
ncbi:arylsulfatase E [Thecamonas trahens ATCC 50062]|uniref:Arylsulfatase E n=1 Tax=Thecamonas trahens ATCC 50062 TaxID=461836 RepID=A0A0L0D7Y8_THETB|nr:arylsulfatase E [Thecamonas trahens ATCC 50062]KNC47423.1 arylsulfatase E [Thecamonas trahens ATCC 50062]|eukprot:XP_013759759.1 arylsulfatase E [Thecamonas trahens ATCC 50062]